MDADTRPNSAVMAYVGPRGARFDDLLRKLGWQPERLEAVLRGLVRSRVLVRRDGIYLRPELIVPPKDDPEPSEAQRAAKLAQQAAMVEKYRAVLAFRSEGNSLEQVAEKFGWSREYAQQACCRARAYFRAYPEKAGVTRQEYDARRMAVTRDRYRRALALRAEGKTYPQIAHALGLKCQKHARELVLRATRWKAGGGE